MKRKKWSESEELTLLNKYSDLLTSGVLAKLKTREKKFKPIADYVNSLHHLQDPIIYPFKWSWRDVSIKVHNMRHQYLGVKQKIRLPNGDFNWSDGVDHWENFFKYKEVFGDVELETKDNTRFSVGGEFGDGGGGAAADSEIFGENGVMGFDIGMESDEIEAEEEEDDDDVELGLNEDTEDSSFDQRRKLHKGLDGKKLKMLGAQVLELTDVMLKRKTREKWKEIRDFERDDEKMEMREIEYDTRVRLERLEREIDEEKRRRTKMEEKWEEEKMGLREKMMGMQIEYEKQITQMYANFCQNQLQVLGIVSQFFGNASGGGFGTTSGQSPSSLLQNLQHNGGLGDNVKPEGNSPSEFL